MYMALIVPSSAASVISVEVRPGPRGRASAFQAALKNSSDFGSEALL